MSRCEHCEYRNSWDCEDEYYRVSNGNTCDNFKLDFNTLTDKQKKTIQHILMGEENRKDYYEW